MKPQNHAIIVSGDQLLDVRSVLLTDIIVDGDYQRVEYHTGPRITEIAKNLDFQIAGFLKVHARSNGKYAASDGGSRLAGMKQEYPNGKHKDGSPVYVAVQVLPRLVVKQRPR